MKKKHYNLLIGVLFLFGLCVLVYPAFGNYWNQRREKSLINTYVQNIQEIPEEDYSGFLTDAQVYNQAQLGNALPDAFAAGEQTIDEIYEQILNINGDGLMGYLEIPKIQVRVPVFHGTEEKVLEKGLGHLTGSSLPIGGASTHAVLAGHRGLPSSKLFTDLDLLEIGDVFYMHVLNEVMAYEVDQILIVEPSETDSLSITPGEDLMTLVTCTPYGVNTHRLLVRGHRIPYSEETYTQAAKEVRTSVKTNYGLAIVLGLLAIGIFTFMLFLREKRRRK